MAKKEFQNEVDILKYQREKLKSLNNDYSEIKNQLDEFENKLQEYIKSKNIDTSKINKSINAISKEVVNIESKTEVANVELNEVVFNERDFNELLNEAHRNGYENTDLYDVATKEEANEVNNLLKSYYKEFTDEYKLDKYDYAISGIIGTIAALMDYFLVTNVDGNNVTSGKFKSGVEEFWNKLLSENKIKELEKNNIVSYDISTNISKISEKVTGLCPIYHRFQSLGHDPILGFIFGVFDIMKGQLTAIDGTGRLIIQSVQLAETKNFMEAVITVFGHFLSDVATKNNSGKILSVPAPLTPLLQLINAGSIDYEGETLTIADLSKRMYYDGYNFNHFIGMSLPVLLIEILTRLSFVIKEMFFSKKHISLKDNPKLDVMLCIANGILFAENTGKLAITKNPFSINYVSWIATAKYGFKTLKWIFYDREVGMIKHAQDYINKNWENLSCSADSLSNITTYYIR